ncbi:9961_t:CDS:2, partial [Ambispora leptoticha]
FEPLLKAIENEIQEIPVQGHYFKTVAYADDLTIGIGSPSDWNRVLELFYIYEKASNAKINESKTKLVPLMVMARRVELKGDRTTVITNIKNLTDKFSQRNLSFRKKILVANSLILARIWYAAYLLPLSRKQVAEINRLITIWIKNNSRMLPRYLTFQLSYQYGGLQAPVVSNMLDARMLTVWIRLTTGAVYGQKLNEAEFLPL